MRRWTELFAGVQILTATVVVLGAPVLLMLGKQALSIDGEQFAMLSTCAGVVLGALLSVLVQGHFSREQERDRRLGLGYSVFYKVLRYASDAEQVCRHVERHRPAQGVALHWRTLQPLLLPRVGVAEFTPDELTLFAIGGRVQFVDALLDFASIHNHLVTLNENYRERQESLARRRLENRIAGRPDDNLEVDEDIVIQLAERLLVLSRQGSPILEDMATNIGDRVADLLDDTRFRGQLVRRA